MQYLVLKKSTNKVIRQFNDYNEAFQYCKELKNKYMVVLIELDTTNYQTKGATTF